MKKKYSMLFTALSVGSLVWMGYGYFNKADENPASITSTAQASQTAPVARDASGMVDLKTIDNADEAVGLIKLGAQNKDKLAGLNDPRDLCAVVKGNAILHNVDGLGERRFSKEFETCADRTLHYEAALMQAGSIIGMDNIPKMAGGDYCGVSRLSIARAVLQYELEAGREIPNHDSTLENINVILESCLEKGEFALSTELWNDYANQAIILPFYAPKSPVASR